MYNEYFGFKEAPFSIAPDPRYLYMTEQHREALAHLTYGFNSEGGCILLTGEVGTGKTTVCRCLLEQVPDQANIALVLNPKVTAIELLETICDELKIDYPQEGNSVKTYIDLINKFLIEANARNERTVLIIDEAQNLDSTVLEQLRLLTNLETSQRKLLQIIILGQPELLEMLSRKELRQLAQRITARFHLKPLSGNEVKAYVTHRLAVAGQNVQLFPEAAIKKLYRLSKGVPRLINILCDRALLGAYVQNKQSVDTPTMEIAAIEVFGELKTMEDKKYNGLIVPVLTTIAATTATVVLALYLFTSFIPNPPQPETLVAENDTNQETIQTPEPEEETLMSEQFTETDDEVFEIPQPGVTLAINTTENPKLNENKKLTLTSEDNNKNNPLHDFIKKSKNNNKSRAYAALFRTWKRKFNIKRHASACAFAQTEGLSCLHKQGNLNSLRKINRPAVLRLYNKDGSNAYAIVTKLDDDKVTIDTGSEQFDLSASLLDAHWFGEFTLLWQTPPFYRKAVTSGSEGPIVQWLDQQMVRLYGQKDVPTINDTYSGNLVEQVKKFQQSKGLIPDGVAGPVTFIYLNSELGVEAPRLSVKDS